MDALAARYAIAEAVCFVQYPSWEPLARRLRERHGWTVVYDCMDEHTGFGTHGPTTAADEVRLVAESDLVLATSAALFERLRKARPDVLRLPNAADLERFSRLPPRETSRSRGCRGRSSATTVRSPSGSTSTRWRWPRRDAAAPPSS